MIAAIAIIVVSVLAGTLLALFPRGRDLWMGPMRTFALTAALAVVILHLLPEALSQAGVWAILVFVLGLVTPELLSKLGTFLWRAGRETSGQVNPRDLALEASYFGLLAHRVGDGIGLGAYTGELFVSSARAGVVTALAAHAVPVVAIVVLTFDSVRGRGSALKRAVGLALASIGGVFVAHALPSETFAAANAWVAAFVGGMLLHVVTHDLSAQLPSTAGARVWDLLAAALGVFVSFLGRGAHQPGEHDHDVFGSFEHALVDFAVETGPLLILGLSAGAILAALGTKLPASIFRSRGAVLDAVRGAVMGAPTPLHASRALPLSATLRGQGAAPALVVAFLLAAPELGIETFALSVRFLGWEFAWMRLLGALIVAFFAALLIASLTQSKEPPDAAQSSAAQSSAAQSSAAQPSDGTPALTPESSSFFKRALGAFDELFHHVGAWMILGIVGAALLDVTLPVEAFSGIDGWFAQFSIITLVAVPSYVCAPAATPLAAVLLAKGLSPGAVLVGLLLGPATNAATLVFLRRWFGGKAAAVGVLTVVALSWALGGMMDTFFPPSALLPVDSLAHEPSAHEHDVIWQWLAGLSGLLLLRAMFHSGVRGFLSALQGEHGHGHGSHEHGHGHGGPDGHSEHGHGAHGEHAHGPGGHGPHP